MKDKRIWIVIGCILVIGSSITYYTNSFIKSQFSSEYAIGNPSAQAEAAEETAGEQNTLAEVAEAKKERAGGESASKLFSPSEEDMPTEALAEDAAVREDGPVPVQESEVWEGESAFSDQQAQAGEEAVPSSLTAEGEEAVEVTPDQVPISPLTGIRRSGERSGLETDYRKRLTDLDTQIQRIREEERESNVYSAKTAAETELKMWESELNMVYNELIESLSAEEAAQLALEQQEWLKDRDARALEGSGKGSHSIESLGYATTLVSLTRDRAYELTDRYEKVNGILPDESGESESLSGE